MRIVACLGNPGNTYALNRHNVGFQIGFYLSKICNIRINQRQFSSLSGKGRVEGTDVLLLLPQTYMNKSGIAVQSALAYYKEAAENLIVIHDEIELPFGSINVKFSGGHKGHNGLRSIIRSIATPDFYRLRIGIGRPLSDIKIADYVLSDFSPDEIKRLRTFYPEIEEKIISILKGM